VIAPAVRSAESLSALDYLARVARLTHLARAATARLDTVDVIASQNIAEPEPFGKAHLLGFLITAPPI
jgi:hypothetical protein